MKLERCVQKALDEWDAGDLESAMLHACNAVDGAARLVYGGGAQNRHRFVGFLRDHLELLQAFVPGFDMSNSRFAPSALIRSDEERPDVAEVIYVAHRCSHGHGDEVPAEYELLEQDNAFSIGVNGCHLARLPRGIVMGLVAVAVLATARADRAVVDDVYRLWWIAPGDVLRIERSINDWWGAEQEFLSEYRKHPRSQITHRDGEATAVTVEEGGAWFVIVTTDDDAETRQDPQQPK